MKSPMTIIAFIVPWVIVGIYAAASIVADYKEFSIQSKEERRKIESLSSQISDLGESYNRELKILVEHFGSLSEKESMRDSLSAVSIEKNNLSTAIAQLKARYFPKSVKRLASAVNYLNEVDEALSEILETKAKLLEKIEEMRRLERDAMDASVQTLWFFGMDPFTFYSLQARRARADAEANRLRLEMEALRSTLELLSQQSEANLRLLTNVLSELKRDIENEAKVTYSQTLAARAKEFNLRKSFGKLSVLAKETK